MTEYWGCFVYALDGYEVDRHQRLREVPAQVTCFMRTPDDNSDNGSRSRTLSRRMEPPEDELNSAEAIKIIKQRHKYNKSRGRTRRYKIVEIDDEDSNSS